MKQSEPLGSLVKRRRVALGLSQTALAVSVGCARSQVTNIEHGRRLVPSWKVRRFATALCLRVETLLRSIEHSQRHPKGRC